jgi:hypothetical protein
VDPKSLETVGDFLWALCKWHLQDEHITDTDLVLVLRSGSLETSSAAIVLRYSGSAPEALRTTTKVASMLMGEAVKKTGP